MTLRKPVLFGALLLAIPASLFWPSRPSVVRIAEPGSTHGGVLLFIANPLRDRSPERHAEHLLKLLQEGRCIDAFKYAGGQDLTRIDEACSRRSGERLVAWQLIDRVDRDDKVDVQYRCQTLRNAEGSVEFMSALLVRAGSEWRIDSWAFPPGA